MNFKILDSEGKRFAALSGDNNPIHINNLEGYNSLFGEKICHGCLIILKTFKIIKLSKIIKNFNKYSIKINFYKHFSYNEKINLKLNKKLLSAKLFQKDDFKAEIKIKKINNLSNYLMDKKKCYLSVNKKSLNYFNKENKMGILSMVLNNLTKYVGTIYPGKNSIIREININFNKKLNFNKNKSKIFIANSGNKTPIIKNKITFQNYAVEFQTLKRPVLKPKKTKLKNSIKKLLNGISENILIIGGSSGIGYELLNVFKENKKIQIIATFNKNEIPINKKNLKKIKIDIMKSTNKIKKIIEKNHPLIIYYFATPKININLNDRKNYKIYKSFYVDVPLKILSYAKNFNTKFFYPSTIFTDKNNSSYVKTKKLGEKILSAQNNKKHKINILEIDEIYTKQNLSLFNRNLPNFVELLNFNGKYQKKVFFKK